LKVLYFFKDLWESHEVSRPHFALFLLCDKSVCHGQINWWLNVLRATMLRLNVSWKWGLN